MTSPGIRGMRLFRQREQGHWGDVLADVAQALCSGPVDWTLPIRIVFQKTISRPGTMNPKPAILYQMLFDRYGPQYWWPAKTMTGMMVGAVLVQNTAWTQAAKAVAQLENQGLLDFAAICTAPEEQLWDLVRPAGYFRIKTRRLKALAAFMAPHGQPETVIHAGNKNLRRELLAVYGVGKETADSILCYAAHQPVFVVDAYTKRLFERLEWIDTKAGYDTMQEIVTTSMPLEADTLGEYHALIVRHAKEHCLKRPRCLSCPITLCPFVGSNENHVPSSQGSHPPGNPCQPNCRR